MGNQQLIKIKQTLTERPDYSVNEIQDFSNRYNIINIHHSLCNKDFKMSIKNFLSGRTCTSCHVSKKVFATTEQALCILNEKYTNLYKNFKITSEFTTIRKTFVQYECIKCGYEYNKSLEALHNKKYGCTNCFNIIRLDNLEKLKEKIPKKILNIIDITGEYISHRKPILCKCLLCNSDFTTTPDDLKKGNGCKNCALDNKSLGHKTIRYFLEKNNIDFVEEKIFEDCINIRSLPFDFFIESTNTLIEFDGIQHFQPVSNWGGEEGFKIRVQNDSIKDNFCQEKGIKLIRIPYTESENIENILISSTTIPGTGVESSDSKRTSPDKG